MKAVIADLSGLEIAEIKHDSELADLGIDSLAGMEMVHDIESSRLLLFALSLAGRMLKLPFH